MIMFRKLVKIPQSDKKIGYQESLLTLGSCFSDTVGNKLFESRFDVSVNPFGVIFHPMALANLFNGIEEDGIFQTGELYAHWKLGGKFASPNREELVETLESLEKSFHQQMKSVNVVMVTFGTAWGYENRESKQVVANCHKMPQQIFDKKLIDVNVIVKTWTQIIDKYPDINWVFTVSPVRHWKDGVRENNVSKGILHQAVHELLKLDKVQYFPAYEILLDELRDYRFYASDYLHPSDEAINYIWDRFQGAFFEENTTKIVEKVKQYNLMKSHKLLYPGTSEAKNHLARLQQMKKEIDLITASNKVT